MLKSGIFRWNPETLYSYGKDSDFDWVSNHTVLGKILTCRECRLKVMNVLNTSGLIINQG